MGFSMIDRIEYSITDQCNLNCAYCCHYAAIAKTYFVNFNQFESDVIRLSELTSEGKQLGTLGILGGEPLLHPDFIDICITARKFLPLSRIRVTTNGLLLHKLTKQQLCILHRYDIEILISKYRETDDFDGMHNLLTEYGIIHKFCQNGNLVEFYKYSMDENGEQNVIEAHNNCELWSGSRYYTCHELRDGELYPCSQIARAASLNEKFGTAFRVSPHDSINIHKHTLSEIQSFLTTPTLFCRYCKTKEWTTNNVGTWKRSNKVKEEYV